MVTETGRTIFGEPIPIEEERRRVGLLPEPPKPERKPLVPPEKLEAIKPEPVEVAPELARLKPRIEKAREEQYQRRKEEIILSAHRDRLEEAKELMAQEGITAPEALSRLGAPIPQWAITQAQKQAIEKVEREANVIRVGIKTKSPEFISKIGVARIQKENPKLFKILKEQGIDTYSKAIHAERFVYQQALKQWRRDIAQFEKDLRRFDPELYQVYKTEGQVPYEKAHKAKYKQLPDGQFINRVDLVDIQITHPRIHHVLIKDGFDAADKAIKLAEQKQNTVIKALERYTDKEGNANIYLAVSDWKAKKKGSISPDNLKIVFKSKDVNEAVRIAEVSRKTGVGVPGEEYWVYKGKSYTREEQQQVIKSYEAKRDRLLKEGKKLPQIAQTIGGHPSAEMYLEMPSSQRKGVETLEWLFRPARVLKPEVTLKNIKALDWMVGGAQIATFAMPFTKAAMPFVSGIVGGIFGYSTAKHWKGMSTPQRAISVGVTALVLTPMIGGVVKQVGYGAVKVPIKTGEATVWRGLSVGGRPTVGVSAGRVTISKMGIRYPKAITIKPGYEPISKIETNIMATRQAMLKAGIPEAEVIKVETTLSSRAQFAGKKSPYTPKKVVPEEIKSLSQKGVGKVFEISIRQGKKVKMVYGSTTIKPQLAPELRQWRQLGDIDIQTAMPATDTEIFTQQVLRTLQKTEGKGNVRISSQSATLIETKVKGQWRHAVDIHSIEAMPGYPVATEGSYGMLHSEPCIRVNYPGIGKLEFMRLSESGKRKVASILEWREGQIAPAAHREKDIVDYYVILRTFKGGKIADQWAKAWGQDPVKLLKLAAENPPKILGWRFSPAEVVSKAVGTPSISVVIPSYATKLMSPSLRRSISASVSPYATSSIPSVASIYPSPSAYLSTSRTIMPSGKVSPRIVSPTQVSPLRVSPSLASVKPSPVPSPIVSPKPSLVPSPVVSPKPSAKPSPEPYPSPYPKPYPKPEKLPLPPPILIPRLSVSEAKKRIAKVVGALTWRQGTVRKAGRRVPVWYVILAPYKSKKDAFTMLQPPPGAQVVKGRRSAYNTIQQLTGVAPDFILTLDLGIVDIHIDRPERKAGKSGAIKFIPDTFQRTTSMIQLGKRRLVKHKNKRAKKQSVPQLSLAGVRK